MVSYFLIVKLKPTLFKTVGVIDYSIFDKKLHRIMRSLLEWYKTDELVVYAVREDVYRYYIADVLFQSILNPRKSQDLMYRLEDLALSNKLEVIKVVARLKGEEIEIQMD